MKCYGDSISLNFLFIKEVLSLEAQGNCPLINLTLTLGVDALMYQGHVVEVN